ncbi:MAG TPA: alpha/beta hydrolase [Kofleriaceae bacterium]|jgi:proline iminopeptidase|nr:alpha/beta hydrolase [Kofleriaceae bacterium]
MATARVNGTHLYFETIGSGAPLLMLHGNGLDHTYLRPWHDPLADRARVIYYDQRGNGRSGRSATADHARLHDDAIALLDHLGEAKATVYGHSYGAWLAQGLAARYPDRVERLILCATSPAFDYIDEVIATAQARNPTAAAALISGLAPGAITTDAELAHVWHNILPLYFTGAPRQDILDHVLFSAEGFSRSMEALAGFSMVDKLPSLATPILVLVGRDDYITPPSQARRLAALAPNATVTELEHSGHFPFVEEPDAYLAAIRWWWQS